MYVYGVEMGRGGWGPALFAISYMVGREDKRMNNRTMLPALKKQCSFRLLGSSVNRAFERWRSTVQGVWTPCLLL